MSDLDALVAGGERLDPGLRPSTHDEHAHFARYVWAAERVRGDVLDVACGTGYGLALLADSTAVTHVCGVEGDASTASFARQRAPGARVICVTVPPLPFPDDAFDSVVCFETLEHIPDDLGLVSELRRVLRSGGEFLLSTPNAEVTSPGGQLQNPWHVREYTLPHLLALLHRGGFERCAVLSQQVRRNGYPHRVAYKAVARFPSLCRPERWWDVLAHGSRRVQPWRKEGVPTFWVVACT